MTNFSNPAQDPHTEVKVRVAMEGDLPRLMGIAIESAMAAQWNAKEYEKLFAAESPGHGTGNQSMANQSAASHHLSTHHPVIHRTALVIELDHTVMGFIVGHQVGDEWEIENIVIAEAAQRGGLGARLLGEFLSIARGRGGLAIFLEVRESNLAARTLYGKYGFTEAGRRKMYYENSPEDALILRFNFQ